MIEEAKQPALAALALLVAMCASWQANACDQPLGNLQALVVAGKRVDSVGTDRFFVERAGQRVNVLNGLPLCANDRLATMVDTSAELLIDAAEGRRKKLTVPPGSTVILRTVSQVELLFGRLLLALQGEFDVVMPFARLAAAGTELELEVTETGCAVAQLEGAIDLVQDQGGTTRVSQLESITCTAQQTSAVTQLSPQRCQALMAEQSLFDILARPAIRSTNAIGLFDWSASAVAYENARLAEICANDATARATVDQVQVDWDRPQQALRRLVERSHRPEAMSPQDRVAMGQALLMHGRPDPAAAQFQLAADGESTKVAATAGLGDVERDLGLIALHAANPGLAAEKFALAKQRYSEAYGLARMDPDRGVIQIKLGELALLRIAEDAAMSEARFTEAEESFRTARQYGDPPHARLGMARIHLLRAQLIPTQQMESCEGGIGQCMLINALLAVMAEQQRKPHREAARRELQELITAVPGFAPAEELMGETQYALGDGVQARQWFVNAIAADPGHTSTYLAYSKTLSGQNRRLYERTYGLVTVKAVRELEEVRREVLIPSPATLAIPPAPLTADAETLSFAAPPRNEKTVTLTNRSEASITADSVSIAGPNARSFQVGTDGCTGVSIAARGQCQITVWFRAGQPGRHRATLSIVAGGGKWTREIRLRGEGGTSDGRPVPPVLVEIG